MSSLTNYVLYLLIICKFFHKKAVSHSIVGQFEQSIKVGYNIVMLIDGLIILGVITFVLGLIAGIVLLMIGFKGARKLALIKAGWIIIGVLGILTTLAFIYLFMTSGLAIILLIFGLPLLIIIGQIVTLVLGIGNLTNGSKKLGIVFLVIHLAVATTVIVLLVMFMTGLIPIRLM